MTNEQQQRRRKGMRRKKKRQLQMLGILIALFLIVVGVIVLAAVGIKKLVSGKKLESITLAPNFTETELDVNLDYTFSISAVPEDAKIKDLEFISDNSNVTFDAGSEEGTAVMHTISDGVVTVCVKAGDIESNYLSFNVVDSVAQQAAKEAELAAQEAAAAEAEAQAAAAAESQAKKVQCYVKTIDKVRIRKSPSTDSNDNIITTCEIGEVYLRLEEVDDWSRIVYDDGEAYIKSEFVEVLSDEEAAQAQEDQKNKDVEDALKKAEEQSAQATANDPVAAAAAQEAKAAEDAAKAAADAEAAAQLAAQAAAAQAAAAGTAIHCKDGTCYVTAAQLQKIHATWDFAGDAIEMAGHHSIGELEAVIGPTQH